MMTMACPMCQSIVSNVNVSTHKRTRKCKQLRDGNTASNYRKTVQTVSIFDGVNAEPRIAKYDIYTYGPDDPGIKDYDIEKIINKDEQSVGSSAASPCVSGVGIDDADHTDVDDSDAEAFSAVSVAAGACDGIQSI